MHKVALVLIGLAMLLAGCSWRMEDVWLDKQ